MHFLLKSDWVVQYLQLAKAGHAMNTLPLLPSMKWTRWLMCLSRTKMHLLWVGSSSSTVFSLKMAGWPLRWLPPIHFCLRQVCFSPQYQMFNPLETSKPELWWLPPITTAGTLGEFWPALTITSPSSSWRKVVEPSHGWKESSSFTET